MQITNVPENKHLTATEKKAIVAILQANLTEGKVGRKIYRISKVDGSFKVMIEEKTSNDFGKMITRIFGTTFNIKGV